MHKRALIVLVGITANRAKRARLAAFFMRADDYDVYVPAMPQRLGLRYCVRWLRKYLSRTVARKPYQRIDFLSYISGGLIFRYAIQDFSIANLGRVVFVRSPVQEKVPAALVAKFGKLLTGLMLGRMVLDLCSADLGNPPIPENAAERGLIIESGVSEAARSLGLSASDVPAEIWKPASLLSDATDWRSVPESHDDIYTAPSVLSLVHGFLRDGHFPPPG